VSVTTLAASCRPSQLGALCHSIAAFLAHCRDTRDAYDALILTRFDLYFKPSASILRLLTLPAPGLAAARASTPAQPLECIQGIRFSWRQTGSWGELFLR
jgi:hypothetical protein